MINKPEKITPNMEHVNKRHAVMPQKIIPYQTKYRHIIIIQQTGDHPKILLMCFELF